ncbi:MAG: flavodoxin family protein [Methanolinea sp.]
MKEAGDLPREKVIEAAGRSYLVRMWEEDLGAVYPGMVRYTVELVEGGRIVSVFRTNTYEYAPTIPYGAREVAERTFARWVRELGEDAAGFEPPVATRFARGVQSPSPPPAVVVIQGSPRPGGNCSILASWVAGEAGAMGLFASIVYPHDMDIHPCTGCYQCYNTGECVFDDDMAGIIDAVSRCRLLVVCTPVYTNTVPAGTKALFDRFQAYHAQRTLSPQPPGKGAAGLLVAVAGRRGKENFTCVSRVVSAFFSIAGIRAGKPLLIDGMDEKRDVRSIGGLEEDVRAAVRAALGEG